MATPSATHLLDTTLEALQGGLPKITDAAHASLAGWVDTLQGNADLAAVATELQKLQEAIAQNHHGTIADSLSILSQQTAAAAVQATPDSQSKLYQLSDVLKQAAHQISF
ncbi:MAG: hypothetical protein EOO56_25540 [Hymenobacter sp.]|nr:MAG: hypothetical protein EOO56_25540 [Hymenobacter sp.]